MADTMELPTAEEIKALTAFADRLADAAASVTMQYFRKPVDVTNKEDDGFDPVTAADRGAEEAIRALLDTHYPEHAIIGEEFGRKDTGSDFTWVLDPVDGTRAFISGLPTWGTLIALLYKGTPIIGVIDQPYLKERYVGVPGSATLNGEIIKTRPCATLATATLSTTDPDLFSGKEAEAFQRVKNKTQLRRYGLDCYAYAILASGFMDVIVESNLAIYDMMALIPVVRGAGGAVSDWSSNAPGESDRLLAVGDPALLPEVERLLAS